MKIISNFLPPKESSAYNPAKSVEVQPGATAHLTMNGMGGERYGIRKILPFSANMNTILISARLNVRPLPVSRCTALGGAQPVQIH
jgi:hypothetical protein